MKMWTRLFCAFCPDRAFYLIPHSSNSGLLYALLMPAHSDGPLLTRMMIMRLRIPQNYRSHGKVKVVCGLTTSCDMVCLIMQDRCVVSKNASLSAETIVTVLATLRNMTEPVRVIPEALSIMIRLKFSLTVSITCLLDEEINKDASENNFKQCSAVDIQDDNLIWDQAGTGNNNFIDQLMLEKSTLLYATFGEVHKVSWNNIYLLDDPFSAVDTLTVDFVFWGLRASTASFSSFTTGAVALEHTWMNFLFEMLLVACGFTENGYGIQDYFRLVLYARYFCWRLNPAAIRLRRDIIIHSLPCAVVWIICSLILLWLRLLDGSNGHVNTVGTKCPYTNGSYKDQSF
ncbi:hypothetical protein KIW84_010935 [Lathyrus oleraceus]|uniref:Uncharacterized protein n=1 Tax=Pisum sativum TaxID=3888 RepID=A0A9D4YNA8_PEA|nr:hypothetical protein KIW84_010935 [Pisum sativum]